MYISSIKTKMKQKLTQYLFYLNKKETDIVKTILEITVSKRFNVGFDSVIEMELYHT